MEQQRPFIFFPATWDMEVFMNMYNYGIKDNYALSYNLSSLSYENSFSMSDCDYEEDMKNNTWLSCVRCFY